jgi:hypothetical protein
MRISGFPVQREGAPALASPQTWSVRPSTKLEGALAKGRSAYAMSSGLLRRAVGLGRASSFSLPAETEAWSMSVVPIGLGRRVIRHQSIYFNQTTI